MASKVVYDFAIVGAGVIGASIAYELSRYQVKVICLEAQSDVALGASKANSGIVHSGYDPVPDTLKAKLNVEGARLMQSLCENLSVTYRSQPTLVVARSTDELAYLEQLSIRAKHNDVQGACLISAQEAKEQQPLLLDTIAGALYAPSAVVSPYELTQALMQISILQGVELRLQSTVTALDTCGEDSLLITLEDNTKRRETVIAKCVINCAGTGCARIAQMVGETSFKAYPVKGEYLIFDQDPNYPLSATLFPIPDPVKGKGILVTLTPNYNVLLGPTALPVKDLRDTGTQLSTLKYIYQECHKMVKYLPSPRKIIRSFAGIRPKIIREDGLEDFLIIQSQKSLCLWHVAGIDSPGLSSAPAIAQYVVKQLKESGFLVNQQRTRIAIIRKDLKGRDLPKVALKDSASLCSLPIGDPNRLVCRCQSVREMTIRDAVNTWPYPLSVDGIKRRTRAGMGFCQGNFCYARIKSILAQMYDCPAEKIKERDEGYPALRPEISLVRRELGKLEPKREDSVEKSET